MAEPPTITIDTKLWKQAELWLKVFTADWHGEVPLKLHQRELALDGTPSLSPEFARFLYSGERGPQNPDDRLRTTRAFRRLRRRAPREFDVLYMLVAHRRTPSDVARELTSRAIRLEKPERYGIPEIQVLAVSGLDKVIKWW